MTKRKKTIWLITLMAAFCLAWVSCSEDNKEEEGKEVPGGNGDDNTELPSDVTISFPSGVTGVKYEALSEQEMNKLKAQGHNFVGTPVNVTQDGNTHVVLDDYATVSFKIPDDFPKEQYGELVGVLIGDEGTEYLFPDYAALQKGYVQFKTHHFSIGAAERSKEKLEQLFIEGYAIDNYVADSRKDRAKELKGKLEDAVNNVLDGNEDDLLDDILKQVIESNDIVKGTMEYVEAYEEGTLGDKAVNDISGKVTEEMQTKALAILIGKLKKNPDNKKVMECLEKYMTKENVEKIASNLGEATSSYDMALTYAKDFAKGKMEDYAKSIFPYVKLVEAEAAVIRKLIKFYNDDRIKNMYNEFAQQYMEHGGQVDWGSIVQKYKLNSPVYAYGMELNEIKDLFERRAKKQKAIDEKKEEMADMIRAWGKAGLLEDHENYFDDCDYEARLWLLYILTEKFRKEVRIDLLPFQNEGDEKKYINDELARIVLKYIELYDKNQKGRNLKAFYEWLVKQGFLKKKLEEDVDALKTSGYEFVGGRITMDISFVNQVDWATSMGELSFEAGDNIVSMTPKGKGLHFDLNYEFKEEKYTDVTHCEFDIDDVNLMLENKASLTNLSWTRNTNNWSGPFGYYFYGQWADTDFLLKQTQDMAFATSEKIKQTGWNEPWGSEYYSANFWCFEELHPSTCYFNRWTLGQYIDGEDSFEQKGDHMEESSSIILTLYFKYVE
ncbi:MAG: hypothetical protein IKH32_02760 [Prevotella sp.]|nr:hypothetical protein [Prevotella sp.]